MSAEIGTWVTQFGFPIAAFLLIYLDLRKKVDELTTAIIEFKAEVGKLGQRT